VRGNSCGQWEDAKEGQQIPGTVGRSEKSLRIRQDGFRQFQGNDSTPLVLAALVRLEFWVEWWFRKPNYIGVRTCI
jgi:hypothetical protein